VLPAPVGISTGSFDGRLNLGWPSVSQAQGYNVFVSTDPNPQPGVRNTTTYTTNSASISINDLETGQIYFVAVSAFRNGIEGSRSQVIRTEVEKEALTAYSGLTTISATNNSFANLGVFLSHNPGESIDQSDNGRFTVFLSRSNNLVATPTHGIRQAYLHDKFDNSITLVSRSTTGSASFSDVSEPRISGDGEVVLFVSAANNLDVRAVQNSQASQIFLHRVRTQTTRIISLSAVQSNVSGNLNSFNPIVDYAGHTVVFASYADNLSDSPKTLGSHIYLYSSVTEAVRKVPTNRSSSLSNSLSGTATPAGLTPSGNFMFYNLEIPGTSPSLHRISLSTFSQTNLNLDPNLGLGSAHIVSSSNDGLKALVSYSNGNRSGIFDLPSQTLTVLGQQSSSTKPIGMNGDGRYVVFWSQDDLLPGNSINSTGSTFVLDRQTNELSESTRNVHGISDDGNVLLFSDSEISGDGQLQLRSTQR